MLRVTALIAMLSALALPAGAGASAAKPCGNVDPIVPKGSGGGIPAVEKVRVVYGIEPCTHARAIIRDYYVTRLTFISTKVGYVRVLQGFDCTGGVEPRARIVCKRKNALVEGEKA